MMVILIIISIMDCSKTNKRKILEQLEDDIHKSWLKDMDRVDEMNELINILNEILNLDNIEAYFQNDSDFDYFIKKFSKEVINNILRQHFVYGKNGDDVALQLLTVYLKIFIKFIDKSQYLPLWDSVKDIFDSSKAFYKAMMYGNMRIDPEIRNKKQMTNDHYNENFLPKINEGNRDVTEGDILDVYIENKRVHHINDRKIWTRAKVIKVENDFIAVKSPDDYGNIIFRKGSFDYAPIGTMTKDYDWRTSLNIGDVIDCYDRGRWYPSTVINKSEENIQGMMKIEYKIGFRIYPEYFKQWSQYTKFWPDKAMCKDAQLKEYYGDAEGMDEWIPSYSKRIQKLDTMTNNSSSGNDMDNFYIDDFIPFEIDGKKNYVIARNNNFSYYFAKLLINFSEIQGFEKLISILASKPNPEIVHYIFLIIGCSSGLLHKEYIKLLAPEIKKNVLAYINDINQNDLRNIRKETIEIITKVLKYYLSVSLPIIERNEIIEKFAISIALKMLKTTFLEKRISAIKSIVDTIRSEKSNPEKSNNILKMIEENQIFYEIYGPNSHIQLINKSKELLEIMIQENKLSTGEIEMIWNATKKGDLEGKLTILKTLKEISHSLKENHINMFLDNIYSSQPEDLINEEIDLIYELSTHDTQNIISHEKCIDFFLKGLFLSRNDEGEKINVLINKIFDVTMINETFKRKIINSCIESIDKGENTILSLKLIQKFLPSLEKDTEIYNMIIENNNLINIFIKNFKEYQRYIKTQIKTKDNKDIDLLALDNFTHTQNLKGRLEFINNIINNNLWTLEDSDPIDFLYEVLVTDSVSDKDVLEFYKWIRNTIEKNVDLQIEERIFKLFNEKICKDELSCQNLSIQALESYLKVFLDINSKASNLEYNKKEKNKYEIIVHIDPEKLIGFDILWKIIFESFSDEIMNKGIQILHSLYCNVKNHNNTETNHSEMLLKKCIDLIKQTVNSSLSHEKMQNKITKCLLVLKLMIEESEKKGTARVKSHIGLMKKKIISLKINSFFSKIPDSTIQIYANTTIWELRELLSKKINLAVDFFKISINNLDVQEIDNGKTVQDFNLHNGDEIKLFMNDVDRSIPQVELIKNGEVIPELITIFNEWYDRLSTDGKMLREDCVKFVKNVTNCRDDIGIDDHRVSFMFSTYDPNNNGYISRESFLGFYYDAVLRSDKKNVVWENLRNMGIRNDLKKLDEPYEKHNIDKTELPRFKLAHNESFFNTISNLQDINDSIAKEAFEFLCLISTNPIIYRQILEGRDWDNILATENVYKLIYTLQIIESFLEDIEISSSEVDSFTSEEYILGENHTLEEIKLKKIEWMKNFILNDGFSKMVNILQNKLSGYKNNEDMPILMNTICLQYLIKIIRIFYFSSLKKNDINTDNNGLDLIFVGELGNKILSSFDYSDLTKKLINLLSLIINKGFKLSEDIVIIEDSFEMLLGIISNNDHFEKIENLILNEYKEEFKTIYNFGLLNEKSNIRVKFSNSMIRLVRSCYDKNSLICYLFEETYELITNINQIYEKSSSELFDFFSNIFEIYISTGIKSKLIDPSEFLLNIAQSVNDDINNKLGLSNEIFLGYLKILSKVFSGMKENVTCQSLKEKISQEFNLIQGIMSKVLFKHSSSELISKLEGIELVNPDKFNDSKANRNSNQIIRNECYSFILSMLRNSLENFEKFFSVNVLEEKKTEKKEKQVEMFNRSIITSSGKNEGHVGLYNLGCICYMNSMLQQFFMVPTYRYNVLLSNDGEEANLSNALNIDDNAFHQLQRMFAYLELSDREDYVPQGFCYAFKDYDGNPTNITIQQDAQEFLARFIDKIEYSLKNSPNKYLLQSVFGGKICSQLFCEEGCGTAKNRYEDLYSLSLEVNNMKTIYDSLEKFISPEKIDQYNCETCNKKVTITKRNLLVDLPNVLIVHLQRIFYNYETDRNEKINSRLEFPKVLNLKNYTLEEQTRKSVSKRSKGEENEDTDKLLDTDEIYFRCDEYYEYHLVGVNVHIGSADAGHYFSYINTIRNGTECYMNFNPNCENHTSSWLKFNDSKISKFNISKLEEECYGGKLEQNGEEWNFRSMNDSIQSAYMLIYERRVKSPLKVIQTHPGDDVISYKEDERLSIKKKYDLTYHIGKPSYDEIYNSIYEKIFYENEKNEYYKYKPFYNVERLIPKNYYLEIIEDNSQFQKQQNISDEQFVVFFESVINVLNETLLTIKNMKPETSRKMVSTFMNFIYNILSQKDKLKLLKTAKDKFIHILELSPIALGSVFEFYTENFKILLSCLLNENSYLVSIHSEILFEVVSKAYTQNPEQFFLAAFKQEGAEKIYIDLIRLIDSIINLFPRIPNKYVNKVTPIINFFKNISGLSTKVIQYLASREIIFLLVTFLLGKESPYYADTIRNEKWDLGRPTPDCNQIVELIFTIWLNSRDSKPENNIEIGERDRVCMKHPAFLKFIYKNSTQLFTDFLVLLSTNNEDFTIQSCIEITKYIDDIAFYDDSELFKLVNAILPILQIEDVYQMKRFNIILGYPQMVMDEPNSRNNMPFFGFNNMSEYTSKTMEIKGLVNLRYTTCLIKKLISLKSRDKSPIEIFILIMNACTTNYALLKYIRYMTSEEPYYDDFIQWGITQVTHYTNKYDNTNFINMLKVIVEKINEILPGISQNNSILKDFKSFSGKYLPKDIKKEVISLVSRNENIYILKCDYYTNYIQYSKNLDFSSSRSYFNFSPPDYKNMQIDHPITQSDDSIMYEMSEKVNNEREWFRRILPNLEDKKVVVYSKYKFEGVSHCITRYVAFNNSSRDSLINFSLNRVNCQDINEFIPDGTIVNNIPSFMTKNLLVLMKINPNSNWSFEADNASLAISTSIELIEYKTSSNAGIMNMNNLYSNQVPSLSLNKLDYNRFGSVSNEDYNYNLYDEEEDEDYYKKKH